MSEFAGLTLHYNGTKHFPITVQWFGVHEALLCAWMAQIKFVGCATLCTKEQTMSVKQPVPDDWMMLQGPTVGTLPWLVLSFWCTIGRIGVRINCHTSVVWDVCSVPTIYLEKSLFFHQSHCMLLWCCIIYPVIHIRVVIYSKSCIIFFFPSCNLNSTCNYIHCNDFFFLFLLLVLLSSWFAVVYLYFCCLEVAIRLLSQHVRQIEFNNVTDLSTIFIWNMINSFTSRIFLSCGCYITLSFISWINII